MMLLVQFAVLESRAELDLIEKSVPKRLNGIINQSKSLLKEIDAEEKKTKHDVMAMINVVSSKDSELGRYMHMGLTSQYINDSATALQLKRFMILFLPALAQLNQVLADLVEKHSNTVMLGRTHGQHASPITFGLKVSVFLAEMLRHSTRILESIDRILVGKIRGPVGTGAGLGKRAQEIEDQTMNLLGLNVEENSSQVVGRDRYLELLFILSNISVTLEKLATEIRNLQRPEIAEVMEGFETKTQVGSSAMPSKRNPVDSENICSLARLIRGFITPQVEGSVMWHERDLANSALERFTIPYACILTDYIVTKTTQILDRIMVDEDKMLSNLQDDPLSMSESVVVTLTSRGVSRSDAHEMVRKAAMNSVRPADFKDSLRKYTKGNLDGKEIAAALDPTKFIGFSKQICASTLKRNSKIRKQLESRREELVS